MSACAAYFLLADFEARRYAPIPIMAKKRATKCKNCPGVPMPGRAICRQCKNEQVREKRTGTRTVRAKAASITHEQLGEMLMDNLLRLLAREAGASSIQEAYNMAAAHGALPGVAGQGVPLAVRIDGLDSLFPELPGLRELALMLASRRVIDE